MILHTVWTGVRRDLDQILALVGGRLSGLVDGNDTDLFAVARDDSEPVCSEYLR